MMRILFVCMGNICRSPIAEGVVRRMADLAGLSSRVDLDSAGTHAHHEGERPDPRASSAALRHGYDLSGIRARRISEHDFFRFDLILAMDRQNLASLRKRCPPEYRSKLRLFLEYAEGATQQEITDPYYSSKEGFEQVVLLCEQAARGLLKRIADAKSSDNG